MRIQDIMLVRVPNPDLRLSLRMAKTLVRDAPAKKNEPLTRALTRLIAQIELINNALAHRLRISNPYIVARELDFDRAVDSLWILLRKHLELLAQAYGHPGLDSLPDARKAELELPKLRKIAAAAESVHEQLFAADGTNFTRLAFPAQAEAMAALLRIIEQDELDEKIAASTGQTLLHAIQVCQEQYDEMVADRMRREIGVSEDFGELRTRLRWLIGRYKSAVEGLYDEDEPETEAIVERSLRVLLMVSAHMARSPSAGIDAELDAELVEDDTGLPEIDELGEFEAPNNPGIDELDAGIDAEDDEPEPVAVEA